MIYDEKALQQLLLLADDALVCVCVCICVCICICVCL